MVAISSDRLAVELIAAVGPDEWVYAIRNDASSRTRLFPSLPALLTGLLPGRLAPKPKPQPQPMPPPLPSKDEAEFVDSKEVELIESDSFEVDREGAEWHAQQAEEGVR